MRRLRTRLHLAVLLTAHTLAVRIARVVLRLRRRGGGAPEAAPLQKVSILLMHAWGMGGTIRTTLNLAGYLAQRHDVEIVSVVRRRDEPFFSHPPGVTVTAIDDQRPRPAAGLRALPRRLLRRLPSLLVYPGDRASSACSAWTDLHLLRRLWRLRSGVLIGTRPALNLLALDAACRGLAVVGIEHMNYSAHSPLQQEQIARRYSSLDALVVLTEHDRVEYAAALPRVARSVRIPVQMFQQISRFGRASAPCAAASGASPA